MTVMFQIFFSFMVKSHIQCIVCWCVSKRRRGLSRRDSEQHGGCAWRECSRRPAAAAALAMRLGCHAEAVHRESEAPRSAGLRAASCSTAARRLGSAEEEEEEERQAKQDGADG